MKSQTATPRPAQLTDQPTTWPLFFILPQTHYVKRQRATNAPEYYRRKKPVVDNYGVTSKKQSYLQRGIHQFAAARRKAWLALKHFGRKVVHALVKWCLLPLAIVACFEMVDVAPAELPLDYYSTESTVHVRQ